MDLLKTFIFNDSKHDVRVVKKDGKSIFIASDIGKVLGLRNISQATSKFDEDEKGIILNDTLGGFQNTIFLTKQGVFRLIMRSDKPIARPFQKWVFNLLEEIEETGRYEMKSKIDDIQKKCDAEIRDIKDMVDEIAHKSLIKGSDRRRVVYYGKIKTMDDGSFLIKIGSTNNIKQRLTGLVAEFGRMSIINTFECDRHTDFERELLQRSEIRKHRYHEIVNGHRKSTEVFRLTPIQLEWLVNIGYRNVSKYRDGNNKRDIDEVISTNSIVKRLCLKTRIELPEEIPDRKSMRGHATAIGRKVQKYSPDTKILLDTFNQVMDVIRFNQNSEFSVSGVSNACVEKTLYKGFRWAYLDRDLDDSTFQDIGDTVVKTVIHNGHVATLSPDKTKVVNVYRHFKGLAISMGYMGSDAVIKRMKKGLPLDDGRHILPWKDVEENMRNEWLKNNELPVLQPNHISKPVNQLDKNTGDVIKRFKTMNDVKVAFEVNGRTIHNAINGKTDLRGFKWEWGEREHTT